MNLAVAQGAYIVLVHAVVCSLRTLRKTCVLSTTIAPHALALHHTTAAALRPSCRRLLLRELSGIIVSILSTIANETPRYYSCEPQHRHAFLPSQYPARRMKDPPASACHYAPGPIYVDPTLISTAVGPGCIARAVSKAGSYHRIACLES